MQEDLYSRMGKELRVLFKHLKGLNPKKIEQLRLEMDRIVHDANQLGSPLKEEAERLKIDLGAYLDRPDDRKAADLLKKHALRLEQETREI